MTTIDALLVATRHPDHAGDVTPWRMIADEVMSGGVTLEGLTDLICDHTEADGPRYLYAETLDTLPESEGCRECVGHGVVDAAMGIRGCDNCGGRLFDRGSGRVPTSHRARSEFIRADLERAAFGHNRTTVGAYSRYTELCHLSQELRSSYGHGWFSPETGPGRSWMISDEYVDDPPEGIPLLNVARGWPYRFTGTLADLLAHADALCRMPLTAIRTDRVPWQDEQPRTPIGIGWLHSDRWTVDHNQNVIPKYLWELLPRPFQWDTPDLAHAALSKACCAWLTQRRKAVANG